MTPEERYRRMQEILEAARLLEPPERATFFARACGGDDDLRREVESLVRHEPAAAAAMPTHAGASGGARAMDAADPARIGPYRVVSVLGDGGFGVVYLAEQTTPVARRVAVKVIKPGMDTRAVLARFEQERQALAMMDHPGVARVFDAGVTEAGRPFFVMEYVRGEPLTAFCDRQRLGLEDRVRLFIRACEAVQHAHQKGVVHRDLKPSNILVEYEGGQGAAPKIIDFGVAKALNQRLTERTIFTEQGQLIGTPEYMSPEQAEMSGLDIDTRSDIYSLGVMLYEVLTGTLPFDARTLRLAGFAEVQRIIREVDPPRPSVRLSVLRSRAGPPGGEGGSPEEAARLRSTDSRRLIRVLRGDLDWIVMRCLEKDRARRYESASGLAADLSRFLRHEPVAAGPPGVGYRVRKFVRRNRVWVAAGAVAAAALVAATGVSIGFAVSEADQRRIAERMTGAAKDAQKAAELRGQELAEVVDFQSAMLSRTDPAVMGLKLTEDLRGRLRARMEGEGKSAEEAARSVGALDSALGMLNTTEVSRHLLDESILRPADRAIGEQFVAQPAVEASLRLALVRAYSSLGLRESALEQARRAYTLRRAELGPEDRGTLAAEHELGGVLLSMERRSEAEPFLTEAMEARTRLFGIDDPETLASVMSVGLLRQFQGRLDEGATLMSDGLAGMRRVKGDDDPATIRAMASLGELQRVRARYGASEALLREVYERRLRLLGRANPETLKSMVGLAGVLRVQGKTTEAAPFIEGALQGYRKAFGDDHPETLNLLNRYAVFLFSSQRPEEAERFAREAAERYRRTQPYNHRAIVITLNTLGVVLDQGLKRPQEAAAVFQEAIEEGELLAESDPERIRPIQNLGLLRVGAGEYADGEALLASAVVLGRRAYPGGGNGLADILKDHGDALRALGNYERAEAVLAEAYGLLTGRGEAMNDLMSDIMAALAVLYEEWNKSEPGKGYAAKAEEWKARAVAGGGSAAAPGQK